MNSNQPATEADAIVNRAIRFVRDYAHEADRAATPVIIALTYAALSLRELLMDLAKATRQEGGLHG